jgi:hypothetical protein
MQKLSDWECGDCFSIFSSFDKYVKHKDHHSLYCIACKKQYSSSKGYNYHENTAIHKLAQNKYDACSTLAQAQGTAISVA